MTEQHNAMVFDAETIELADGNETTKVSKQFLQTVSSNQYNVTILRYGKYNSCVVIFSMLYNMFSGLPMH